MTNAREDAVELLDSVQEILETREGSHGTPEDNFRMIAQLWSIYLDCPIDETNVAEMMVLMKIARAASGVPTRDHYADVCGYAALAHGLRNAD